MPSSPPKPCAICRVLVTDGGNRCAQHRLLLTGRFGDPARGSRQARGYGAEWTASVKRIKQRDGGICQACMRAGRVEPGAEVDHIKPKTQGGSDDDDNLQLLCSTCHREKTLAEALRGRGLTGRG